MSISAEVSYLITVQSFYIDSTYCRDYSRVGVCGSSFAYCHIQGITYFPYRGQLSGPSSSSCNDRKRHLCRSFGEDRPHNGATGLSPPARRPCHLVESDLQNRVLPIHNAKTVLLEDTPSPSHSCTIIVLVAHVTASWVATTPNHSSTQLNPSGIGGTSLSRTVMSFSRVSSPRTRRTSTWIASSTG